MRLLEALEIIKSAPPSSVSPLESYLACGFQPLHLATFLQAHLQQRFPQRAACLRTGLYGSLEQSLSSAAETDAETAFVVWEWPDLDPRLSLRSAGGWRSSDLIEILKSAESAAARISRGIENLAQRTPVVLACPTTPIVPASCFPVSQTSPFVAKLRAILWSAVAEAAALPSVRVIETQVGGHNPAAELKTGFPYTLDHAEQLAAAMVASACRPAPKKGLITDLDDTLWAGLVGEVGARNVHWDLDNKAMAHGAYQRMLASLADSGVLLAVASKNEEANAMEALRREDLLVSLDSFFPLEISWESKAAAVGRILQAWNIGADSVVFVDDNPIELASVAAAHPQVECMQFPIGDAAAAFELFGRLRELFGKSQISAEDRIRLGSIRAAADLSESTPTAEDHIAVLRAANGALTVTSGRNPADTRAFDLINKTNQFNLNGRRIGEAQWLRLLADPSAFVAVASYKDDYGPLGKIAVVCGETREQGVAIHTWVMSCRAFSRNIEHQLLNWLFDRFNAQEIVLDYTPTERNQPLQAFLAGFGVEANGGVSRLSRGEFLRNRPTPVHSMEDRFDG